MLPKDPEDDFLLSVESNSAINILATLRHISARKVIKGREEKLTEVETLTTKAAILAS